MSDVSIPQNITPTLVGRENVYVCQKCGAYLVTVDRDAGTTPFSMTCNEPPLKGCGGSMLSCWYPKEPRPAHIGPPTHEWYKPNHAELTAECRKYSRDIAEATREHVKLGGLLIRPIVVHP